MTRNRFCHGELDPGPRPPAFFDPESVREGVPRRSRMSRRRALVLILVHLVIFLHLLHWQLAGRTISPLEPSEAMFTLAEGVVNAGAVLLALALLSTLIFGRFFCGWGCHLVGLQDLCAWIMKKLGVRPRPLRSRWLAVVPLLAGLYMFFWAPLWNWIDGLPRPEYRAELVKQEFWETFPGFWVGFLTFLVCGFGLVYLLGAKGFCVYACPYGGLFGLLDRLAPGRIRVSDACRSCGHCTAVCSSNVLVHREVREWGMVVDPGCMKCQDCVSVCPEGALRFGFGRPALFASRRIRSREQRPVFLSLAEEALLLAAFAISMLILRGLPDRVIAGTGILYGDLPLLFALGLSGLSAFAALMAFRLLRRPEVSFLGASLKSEGRLRPRGRLGLGIALIVLLFVVHCAWVQLHMFRGNRLLDRTAPLVDAVWRQDASVLENLPPQMRAAVEASERHYLRADQLGLFSDWRLPRQRAWLALVRRDTQAAGTLLRQAVALKPEFPNLRSDLGRILLMQAAALAAEDSHLPGDPARAKLLRDRLTLAAEEFLAAAERRPNDPVYQTQMSQAATVLAAEGLFDEAAHILARASTLHPDHYPYVSARVEALLRGGRAGEALAALRTFLQTHPGHADAQEFLILVRRELGLAEADIQALEEQATSNPDDPKAALRLAEALLLLGRRDEARQWFAKARELDPAIPVLPEDR